MTNVLIIVGVVLGSILLLTEVIFKKRLVEFKKKMQATERIVNKDKYRSQSRLTKEQWDALNQATKELRKIQAQVKEENSQAN